MYPRFPASQTEIADLFAVEWKKFFTSVMGREYEGGQKLSKVRKLESDKPPGTKGDKDKEYNASPAQEPPTPATDDQEVDPKMPELEDTEPPNQRSSTLRSHNQHQGRSISPRNNCHYLLIMPELIFYIVWKFPKAAMMHQLKLHSSPLGVRCTLQNSHNDS